MNFITADDGITYILNFDKLITFSFQSSGERLGETNISELYNVDEDDRGRKSGILSLVQKQVDERKIDNSQATPVDIARQAVLNSLLERVFNIGFNQQDGGKVSKTNNLDTITFSESLAFNTLLHLGIIEQV